MYTGMMHTHKLAVILFLLLYLIKTLLLVLGKTDTLARVTKATRVAEMIISTLFLATGIYLAINTGNKGMWLWMKLVAVAVAIPLAIIGFKRANKNLALLSLILIVFSYGISETKSLTMSKDKDAGTTVDNSDIATGEIIYKNKCVLCHGDDGKLGLSGSKDLTASTLSRDEKINIITNGKNAMQPYNEMLTANQIIAVTNYVETLK